MRNHAARPASDGHEACAEFALGVVQLAREGARDEARRLGALASKLLPFLLVKGDIQVGNRLVDLRRPNQLPVGESQLKASQGCPRVVDGVALLLDQL